MKTQVVIIQLGSPVSPEVKSVRLYLRDFLKDPRVVDLPKYLWWIILNFFVLPFRPKESAKKYARIWNGTGFPLYETTERFGQKLTTKLGETIKVSTLYILGKKRVKNELLNEIEPNVERVLFLPQFPQYSEATTASVFDTITEAYRHAVNIPRFEFISNFHCLKAFIDLSAKQIDEVAAQNKVDAIVLSFHGIPTRRVTVKKDVYYEHCFETFTLIKSQVKSLAADKIHFTFQSRFGSEPWLAPYTDAYCKNLVEAGVKKIAVYCPSFTVDCLETTDEIGHELKEEMHEIGGEIFHIPCLNDRDQWVHEYASYIETLVLNDTQKEKQLFYEVNKKEIQMTIPEQNVSSKPLGADAKQVIKIVFLTLFIDLIGFSIIFPMFPAMAKHYLLVDGDNFFLKAIFGTVTSITSLTQDNSPHANIVLFGGILGALYSFLQFIAAPIWGTISDRIGRKPVLLISVAGLFLSYVLWFFSGSFTTLILARLIGGLMGGNMSTASAAVADVTDRENRSKGMAFIGIAFALGFILGPAIGGALSMIDLTQKFPQYTQLGLNPFSMPALVAAVLSFINFFSIWKNFKETLPQEKRGKGTVERTANIFKLFKPAPYPGVNGTNISHFLFLTAFSGMEFTLTFLAVERLGFSSMDNAYMFVYIGFIIAFVQGGYVRRKANTVGENKMTFYGLVTIIPGLIIIAFTHSIALLYAGLFFLAAGAAMIIPCQTSAVSLYSPQEVQGHMLGIFRSLGSLARVIGPIIASLIYWKFGGSSPYLIGAASLIIPIMMVKKLPEIRKV